ncbi:recombinase family protein [Pseudomonas putida]|uniref:recombinase family protein n=1 Tax=Pseudomonas putida TaxID=303 RepID=UPI001F0B04D9|nr:recombinase family protein [Pseudomonas putida]
MVFHSRIPHLYARFSTGSQIATGQTTENQIVEIATAGFTVEPHRTFEEIISGSTQASERPVFSRMLDRMERSDVLIVTKLDRLGRNAMDVRSTVEALEGRGIRVHCLALGGVDLTSPAGKMTMQVLSAVAEFERDLLIERTQAGLTRAKAQGKKLGRPEATETIAKVQACKADNLSQSETAKKLSLGIATVKRHWNK